MPIALDAMGGDYYPRVPVEAALLAVSEGTSVVLVGDEKALKKELQGKRYDAAKLVIHHASEVIEMHEPIVKAMRTKKDASMRVCYDLHKAGEVAGVVSAGSSGAMLAIGKFVLKTLPGVDRPCISALMPSLKGKLLLVDAGANMDCDPAHLVQFAALGEIYMRVIHQIPSPRVALLNIGSEEGKGDERSKKAFELIKLLPINFIGNLEGKEFFDGNADVVVCDGFSGNVLLKSVQGAAKFMMGVLKEEIKKSKRSMLGAAMMKPAFNALKARSSYQNFGGAPLLGLNGVGVVCHGSSDATAIHFGIQFAHWADKAHLVQQMTDSLQAAQQVLNPQAS
ncbi:MAG: phosphate acyltransferase PlsX [bacterium]|nr:phosphate acyltransferase PlsX [bacterium]